MEPRLPPAHHLLVMLCITLTVTNAERKSDTESEWGDWEASAACSRTCGGGIQLKQRNCLNTGSDGVARCGGPDQIYTTCNPEPCPEGSVDFRLEQCQKYNDVGVNIPDDTEEEWVPYYGATNKCQLNCLLKGTKFYYTLAPKVVDGTPCDLGSKDICVDGVCQNVGCDGLLGSDKQTDSCGVCGGDDSTCDTYRGDIKTHNLKVGYSDVMILPAGTTSLRIQEHSHSSNYLALRSLNGEYYLNKDWQIERSQSLNIAGTTFQYKREGNRETLTAEGPLEEPIYIVIIRQAGHGAMFRYSYSVPHELSGHRSAAAYNWQAADWGECSEQCAGGLQSRSVICTINDGTEVDDNLCNPLYRPADTQDCNTEPCEASWETSEWQTCSTSCGEGLQVRAAYCKQPHHGGIHAMVEDEQCTTSPRPETVRPCNQAVPCPVWINSAWSNCNRVCGPGQKIRSVTCQAQHHIPNALSNILPDQRCTQVKPLTTEPCNEGPCHGVEWIVSDWSGCRGTCSHGIETRRVVCSTRSGRVHDDGMCDSARRPESSRPCSQDEDACEPKPQWHASQWSKCSARCGPGIQRRHVVCAEQDGDKLQTLPDSDCDPHHKMAAQQSCNGTDCLGDWFSGPYGKCSAVCGGGQRQRQVMCFVGGDAAEPSECDGNLRPDPAEDCNLDACDDDDLIVIGGCKNTVFGCCPDGITAADGDHFLGCPSQDRIPVGLCIESDFGCCFDGVTPALGPFAYGCPEYSCRDTKHGCCPDGQTPADGAHGQGCPVYYSCDQTAFGCCPDGINPANGFNNEGCEVFLMPHCSNTIFGCCDDNMTPAQGPGRFGCMEEGSGEIILCEFTEFGCCYDGVTVATGPQEEGCNDIVCQGALYGCCPDGVTAAIGPGYMGCAGIYVPDKPLCATSQYGCCSDGLSAAAGPYMEGCESSECNNELYGCCPDGVTAAQGPEGQGCEVELTLCGDTPYGCCPDYITPAQGPGYDGCPGAIEGDCENTLFGCCPDGVIAAAGFDHKGCPVIVGGCAGTRHGCCPDGTTSAHGPNMEECPGEGIEACHNSLFGCCPDGTTYASGPGYAGCALTPLDSSCDLTAYGCCLDGYTIATGPHFEGCVGDEHLESCGDGAYGCCPDGVSTARGPNYAGCPSTVDKGVSCGLVHERGSCSNYSVQWHYDPSYGDCKRFWYGGCDGNNNRFETKELCKEQCVKPKGLERCYLPKSVGRCRASEEKYYYDHATGACQMFMYGGCLGNDNRFDDQDECVHTCVQPHKQDTCNQPMSVGPCRGRFRRWYFDEESQTCRDFVYGGCLGNENQFERKEDCEGRCLAPLNKVCNLAVDSGPCKARLPRWFFNTESGSCQEFMFGGCRGNGNKFSSQSECENTCQELTKVEKDICSMPMDAGPCEAYMGRWYYNQDTGYCNRFVYGGCEGNDNQFETEEACRQMCDALPPLDVCELSMDIGPCQESHVRYYYDVMAQGCRQMVYGGCDGNENNFMTAEECQKVCGGQVPTQAPTQAPTRRPTYAPTTVVTEPETPANKCDLRMDPGPCLQSMVRWYYDRHSHTCRRFEYGGCEGNRNRFLTVEHCINDCGGRREHTPQPETRTTEGTTTTVVTTTTPLEETMTDLCTLLYNPGPCYAYRSQWYYDPDLNKCKQFLYGGCGGNNNRFESRTDCEQACFSEDVCSLEQDPGECSSYFPSWYFDEKSGGCEQFIYGGCGGNGNRFETRELCESKCGIILPQVTGLDICALDSETGPCQAGQIKYHYSVEDGQCLRFSYGGCQGNANNFDSKNDCQKACPTTDICALPKKRGRCRARKLRFHYNPASGYCEEFHYGGCDGNANRFLSLDSCVRVCAPHLEQPVTMTPEPVRPVQTTAVPTPVYEEPDTIGGSVPGTDRMTGTTNVCQLPKDPGPCRGFNPFWYFEPVTRTCRRFLYGGCDGNGNRYDTREMCQQTCLNTPAVTTAAPRVTTTTTMGEVETDDGDLTTIPGSSGAEVTTEDTTDFDMCMPEKDAGEYCSGWEIKWHFDSRTATCRQFYYGGCKGNENRFSSEEDCMKTCVETEHISSQDDCYLPMNKGPCFAQQPRWYYDNIEGQCKDFIYGGCHGNRNRFLTRAKCETVCKFKKRKEPDMCAQTKEVGPCQAFKLRFYFDQTEGRCLSFQFGGCQGNKNNFETEKACYMACSDHMVEEKKEKTKDDCRLDKEPGPCQADFTRFFYDEAAKMCRPFMYGGCQGNGNNFETQADCYQTCAADEDRRQARILAPGDCYDPQDPGTCDDATPRWYFDHNGGECKAFYYSGCEGNGNNFLHYEDCSAFCSKISETCGVLQCNLNCPFGFARGLDGCPQCECRDPCLTHRCSPDKECRQEQVVCVREPCKPLVVCRPKPKVGECPKIEADNMAMCVTECQEDVDCRGDAKCCSNGCGLVCVVPYTPEERPGFCPAFHITSETDTSLCRSTCRYDDDCLGETDKCCHHDCGSLCVPALPTAPECRKSVFGCCPDDVTQATGWNFIGCPEEAPHIDDFGQLDIVAVVGEEVTIPCVAKGAPAPQTTWYKSRFPLEEEDSLRMTQQEDGSLVIGSVQPQDSTTYTCRAYNNVGSATKTYTLLVQVPVAITEISRHQQVGPGDDITLSCVAIGNPTPEIRWLHGNTVILTSDSRYFVDKEGTLLIERAVLGDEGEYMCEANNGVGEPVTAATLVDVLGPFMVEIAAHNMTVQVGSDLRLVCQVTGDLTDVTVQWLKDSFPLLEDTDDRIRVTAEGELLVEDMMKSDEGRYTCSATRYESEISKSTSIYTEGIQLPTDCTDKPWYANCNLIIEARMCRHAYFKVFCCKSCHEAGLLP